jgi:hypothetical protein
MLSHFLLGYSGLPHLRVVIVILQNDSKCKVQLFIIARFYIMFGVCTLSM